MAANRRPPGRHTSPGRVVRPQVGAPRIGQAELRRASAAREQSRSRARRSPAAGRSERRSPRAARWARWDSAERLGLLDSAPAKDVLAEVGRQDVKVQVVLGGAATAGRVIKNGWTAWTAAKTSGGRRCLCTSANEPATAPCATGINSSTCMTTTCKPSSRSVSATTRATGVHRVEARRSHSSKARWPARAWAPSTISRRIVARPSSVFR